MGFYQHQGGPVFNRMDVVAMLVLQLIPEFFNCPEEAAGTKVDALFRQERR